MSAHVDFFFSALRPDLRDGPSIKHLLYKGLDNKMGKLDVGRHHNFLFDERAKSIPRYASKLSERK